MSMWPWQDRQQGRGLLVPVEELFLGRPVRWWVSIFAVLQQHRIADADQLAFKLMARASGEERRRIVDSLLYPEGKPEE